MSNENVENAIDSDSVNENVNGVAPCGAPDISDVKCVSESLLPASSTSIHSIPAPRMIGFLFIGFERWGTLKPVRKVDSKNRSWIPLQFGIWLRWPTKLVSTNGDLHLSFFGKRIKIWPLGNRLRFS